MLYIFTRQNTVRLAWGGKVSEAKPAQWERWQPYQRRQATKAAI